MTEQLRSQMIPNLIQGVSQQAVQSRRDTQCEEQYDCINSPVDGAVNRPGFDLVAWLNGEDYSGAFCFPIKRALDEHYLVVLPGDGTIKVYDLADGTDCTVTGTPTGMSTYLSSTADAKVAFCAATVGDFTFLGNREISPAMDSSTSAAALNEAFVVIRAGAYLTKYKITVTYNGSRYSYTYETPDNSAAANAEYITTAQIASTLARALDDATASAPGSSTGVGSLFSGLQEGSEGGNGDVDTVGGDLDAQGFVVSVKGNVIRISRADSAAFSVDVADGGGNDLITAFKGTVDSISQLPERCYAGTIVKVKGIERSQDDDYYLQYFEDATGSYWEECLGPGQEYIIDAETMPYALVNTAAQTFTFQQGDWADRVVGDSESDPDPSFIGSYIRDMGYDHRRLAFVMEGSTVWSKARKPFVFFRDTVQAQLADEVIDVEINGTKEIALSRRMVHVAEATFIWAINQQFRVTSGVQPFTSQTVDPPPSTHFEFSEGCQPEAVGSELLFASERGSWAVIRSLFVQEGLVTGDLDITRHVPKYIAAGVEGIAASDTRSMAHVWSSGAGSYLYTYNWFINNQRERVQEAWNTWRLPSDCTILWAGIFRDYVRLLVQRTDGVAILQLDTTPKLTDPGASYLTRMDFRLTEADITVGTPGGGSTVLTLPYEPLEAENEELELFVVQRATVGANVRGKQWPVTAVSGHDVTVTGDLSAEEFYIGFQIKSERVESEFHLRGQQGGQPVERLQVYDYFYQHTETGYYRIETTYTDTDKTVTTVFDVREDGAVPVMATGSKLGKVAGENLRSRVRIINDTWLPAAWQSAEVHFTATYRARPRGAQG